VAWHRQPRIACQFGGRGAGRLHFSGEEHSPPLRALACAGAPATELGSQNFLLEFAMKKSRVLNASEALKGRVLRDGQPARISSGTRFLVRGMSTDNLLGMKMPSRSGNDLKSKDKRRQHPSAREHFVPISEASHRLSSTCPARVHEITVGSSSAAPPRWSSYSESHFPRQYAARHSDREGRLFS